MEEEERVENAAPSQKNKHLENMKMFKEMLSVFVS